MDGDPAWIWGGYLLFGALLALEAGVLAETKRLDAKLVVHWALLAVFLEYALTLLLPASMAITQSRSAAALVLASVTGIWGVSLLVWLSNLSISVALANRKMTLLLCALPAVGIITSTIPPSKPARSGPRIAVVQTQSEDPDELVHLTPEGTDLAVWPELSGKGAARRGDTRQLKGLSKEPNPAFVTSFEDDARPKPHNTAALFWNGRESLRYWKRKPFAGELAVHEPGDSAIIADWRYPVGLNVCFDSCYPGIMLETARSRPWFIALPTQDPVTPNGIVQSIHAAYTPFRAAELGTGIARADVTADSMIVAPNGAILTELGAGERAGLAQMPAPHDTLYKHLGDWFLWVTIAAFGALITKR